MQTNASKAPLFTLLFILCLFTVKTFAQSSYNICTASYSNQTNGLLYDSGGPNGEYKNNEYCTFFIDPACASSMTLTFESFNSESCCDYLYIYDGENEFAPLVFTAYGYVSPGTVISLNSKKAFIRWYSDVSIVYSGFKLRWETISATPGLPVAGIAASASNPPVKTDVDFSALASPHNYAWYWDFGDGQTAEGSNVSHNFQEPGTYTVQLVAENCVTETDTATYTLTVQDFPVLTVDPTSIELDVSCGSIGTSQLTISNTGNGDMVYNAQTAGETAQKNVLFFGLNIYDYNVYYSLLDLYFSQVPGVTFNNYNFYGPIESFKFQLDEADLVIIPQTYQLDEFYEGIYTEALYEYISNGGKVVYLGGQYYPLSLNDNILEPNESLSFGVSNLTVNEGFFHPTTGQMPGMFVAPQYTGAFTFPNNGYVSCYSYSGLSVLGYRNIGSGTAMYCGFSFNSLQSPEYNSFIVEALKWAAIPFYPGLSGSGVLAPGESVVFDLTFDASYLIAGDYTGAYTIKANTEGSGTTKIEYTIHVSGVPEMEVAQENLGFGTIMQYRTASQKVGVTNPSCAQLEIQDITFSAPGFSTPGTSLSIMPYITDSVDVRFEPQTAGSFSAYMYIHSAAGVDSVLLEGEAFPAPIADISPDTVVVDVTCGETTQVSLTLSNTGGSVLEFGTKTGYIPSNLDFLVLAYGTFTPDTFGLLRDMIQQRFPDAEIRTLQSGTPSVLTWHLQYADVVLIPSMAGFQEYHEQYAALLRKFLNRGGRVMVMGSDNPILMGQTFEFDVTNYFSLWGFQNEWTDPQHPMAENLPTPFYIEGNGMAIYTETPAFNTLAKYPFVGIDGAPTVGYKEFQQNGRFVYIAPYYNNNISGTSEQLFYNAVNWLYNRGWIDGTQQQSTLAPGEDLNLELNIDASNLIEGTYTGFIQTQSNDPLHPFINTVIIVHVSGQPELNASNTEVPFGSVLQFSQNEQLLTVYNDGCDTLLINNMSIDNPAFTLGQTVNMILPQSSVIMAVGFSADITGAYTGTLSIESNGGNLQLPLSAQVEGAALLQFSPPIVSDSISCKEGGSQTLTIHNEGLADLSFSIQNDDTPKNILILSTGSSSWQVGNLVSTITSQTSNVNFTETFTNDPAELADQLKGKQVLIIPPFNTDMSQFLTNAREEIQAFVSEGGTVLMTGNYYYYNLNLLNFFTINYGNQFYDPQLINNSPAHPYLRDIPVTFKPNQSNFLVFFLNGGMQTLASLPGSGTFLSSQNYAQGRVVYCGYMFENSDPFVGTILRNVLNYTVNPAIPGVTWQPESGTVPPGGSMQVTVDFSSGNLPGGIYFGYLNVASNSPIEPVTRVPLRLYVSSAPCANFTYTSDEFCNGLVSFTDLTLNSFTTRLWDFGDGSTSTSPAPTHTYADEGNYTVTLTGCNSAGCDTLIQTVVIDNIVEDLLPASCRPPTLNYCCGYGIYRFSYAGIDNYSADGQEGYKDFSCNGQVGSVKYGIPTTLIVQTHPNYTEYVKVWIDLNNNGNFENNEQLFYSQGVNVHSGSITIPSWAVRNVPLRVRVTSDSYWQYFEPCSSSYYGQTEDYALIVKDQVATQEPITGVFMDVAPNPGAGKTAVSLQLDEPQEVSVAVYNELGALVQQLQKPVQLPQGTHRFETPLLPPGVYIIQAKVDGKILTRKWVSVTP